MAVKIRLKRMGKKKQPTYRVVVADSRSPRDGRIIESIGRYDPRQDPSVVEIDNERAQYWLGNGAQPTERAQKLLEISGAVEQSQASRSGVYTLESDATSVPEAVAPTVEEAQAQEATAAEEAPAEEAVAEEAPVEEAPAEEVPAEEAAAEEAPAAEAAAEAPEETPEESTEEVADEEAPS